MEKAHYRHRRKSLSFCDSFSKNRQGRKLLPDTSMLRNGVHPSFVSDWGFRIRNEEASLRTLSPAALRSFSHYAVLQSLALLAPISLSNLLNLCRSYSVYPLRADIENVGNVWGACPILRDACTPDSNYAERLLSAAWQPDESGNIKSRNRKIQRGSPLVLIWSSSPGAAAREFSRALT